jgi:hypothetical protein
MMLCRQISNIKVMIWIETDLLPEHFRMKQKISASVNTKVFKRKLNWLTQKVLVCNQKNHYLPEAEVRNLPMRENL